MPPAITENAAYQALGLDAPAVDAGNQGANGQEPAQPAENNPATETGANQQNPAQSAEEPENNETHNDGVEPPAEGASETQGNPDAKPMDEKTRRENAARRRQQEQQAAVQAAVQEALQQERARMDAQWNEFFAASGLKNTITGEPIKTREDYQKWQQEYQAQQASQKLKAGELTPELLQQIVGQHPVVQQAKQLLEQNAAQQQSQQEQAQRQRIQEEISEIGKLDPSIQSVEDLMNMPEAEFTAFKGYVDKGYSFLDSYRLSHMEQIADRRAEQARQQAMNNERGKEHLRPSGRSQGTGPVSVPPAVMRSYRLFNPGATDAEIQAHYNKNMKSGGK